jgi:hypothetical protein
MSYAILARAPGRASGPYAVRGITREDMEPVRRWRNAQMQLLRQSSPITVAQQQRYFDEAVQPAFDDPRPRQVLLVLLLDSSPVGYGGLTNLDWGARRAELSFLAAPERATDPDTYADDFRAFLALVVDGVAFADLRLHRVFAETFDIRPHHVTILEQFGFAGEGRMKDHVRIDGRYADSLLHGYVAR